MQRQRQKYIVIPLRWETVVLTQILFYFVGYMYKLIHSGVIIVYYNGLIKMISRNIFYFFLHLACFSDWVSLAVSLFFFYYRICDEILRFMFTFQSDKILLLAWNCTIKLYQYFFEYIKGGPDVHTSVYDLCLNLAVITCAHVKAGPDAHISVCDLCLIIIIITCAHISVSGLKIKKKTAKKICAHKI